MADILVMEPEGRTNRMMCRALETAGHTCRGCGSVAEGSRLLQGNVRMATVLNAGLPWRESRAFLDALKSKGLPVLFVTAVAANAEHLKAMYGEDCDVLLCPFTEAQLVQAMEHLLAQSPAVLTLGGLWMDVENRLVKVQGRPLTLTTQEFALLQALMRSPNATLSREELLRTAWGYQGVGITRTVDVHVQRLRRKLGGSYIETIYKMGYRLHPA